MNNQIRYKGETFSFLFALFIALLLSYFIFEMSTVLLISLLVIQLTFIVFTQKQTQGNSIEIGDTQFNEIHQLIQEVADTLEIQAPNSYVTFDPYINAFVMGFSKPYTLVLSSSLVEAMSKDELKFVIGHELGHIKYGHSRFKSLIVPVDKNIPVVTFIFNQWLRKAEYTSDRTGFLSTKSIEPSISALLKITVGPVMYKKLNIDQVVHQIEKSFDEKVEKVSELFLTHPYVMNRIKQLVEYQAMLKNFHD